MQIVLIGGPLDGIEQEVDMPDGSFAGDDFASIAIVCCTSDGRTAAYASAGRVNRWEDRVPLAYVDKGPCPCADCSRKRRRRLWSRRREKLAWAIGLAACAWVLFEAWRVTR